MIREDTSGGRAHRRKSLITVPSFCLGRFVGLHNRRDTVGDSIEYLPFKL